MLRLIMLVCVAMTLLAGVTGCPGDPAETDVPSAVDSPPAAAESQPAMAGTAQPASEQQAGVLPGLNADLAKIKAETPLDAEAQQIMDESNAALSNREWGLAVSTPAPMFTLKDGKGKDVVLGRYLAKKQPVALLFYRGEWCPYCNKQLAAMQQVYKEIQAAGGEVIAVTPEKPEFVSKLVEKQGITFPVVSDPQSTIAEKYKVAYAVDPKVGGLLSKYGIELEARNGSDKAMLPHPAIYVIDGQGNVRWVSLNIDYTKRAEPVDVVAAIKQAAAVKPAG